MGWKKEKDKFFKKVENEGKKFLQNIVKDEDNTNVKQISPPTVAPPLVSTSAQPLNTPDNEIQNEDPDFILISKVKLDKKKPIGQGAYGVVYSGTLNENQPIAAKRIVKTDLDDSALKEMKFLKSVKSDLVLTCHGFSEDEDFFYIILEKMHCNLFQYLFEKNQNLELNKRIKIILQVARSIDCLHQQKITHLDVKPSNFLVNEDGSIIKIADFGISKEKKTNNTSFTLKFSHLGTSGYQAPELFVNGDFGPHSDIYSFGIMMFEIVFGKSPYTEDELSDFEEFKKDVRKGKRPNLDSFELKDVNKMILVGLMKQCWDTNKYNRPTASEIVDLLKELE
jgi:serine/threonine protein kinase